MSNGSPSTTASTAVADERGTVVVTASPATPRLLLAEQRAEFAVLDGAWWPRSSDLAAELADLVAALSARYGQIRRILLSSRGWDGCFRRLSVGETLVRIGWFASMDPALLVAITDGGDQVDLLVVPPSSPQRAAEQAMRMAANPENRTRAPHILAATTPALPVPEVSCSPEMAVWDNEGGNIAANRMRR